MGRVEQVWIIDPSPTPVSLERGGKYMYAVIVTGGKQYKVSEGDTIKVEKLDGNVGDEVTFDVVMLVNGEKVLAGKECKAKAHAKITSHGKGDKIVVFKYKAKKNERKRQGHRQPFTAVEIISIK